MKQSVYHSGRYQQRRPCSYAVLLALLLFLLPATGLQELQAQERVPRQVRTYIPPDQLVSFLPSTPFDQFVGFLNSTFQRITGKQIVDPEGRQEPIGIAISGMHFFDAFELVLEFNGLTYRETEQFFIVEEAPEPSLVTPLPGALPAQPAARVQEELANAQTREIQISAVLFEMNLSEARQLGIDWNIWFSDQQQGQTGGQGQQRPRFFIRTERYFDQFREYLVAPDLIEVSSLTQLLRLLETTGVGQTLANPSVTVQSAEKGRIQIGSDIPVTVRDFAGNTITQFVSTGIIIDVTPTLIREAPIDTVGGPTIDFIHMNIQVERSNGRPFGDGIAIDRSTATTQVLLLNREQTIIGGLYSTDESSTRRGIPILKDLPGWFFGLRYLFGFEQRSTSQRELLIVLQARVLDPLPARAERPLPNELLDQFRRQTIQTIERFDEQTRRETPMPRPSNR